MQYVSLWFLQKQIWGFKQFPLLAKKPQIDTIFLKLQVNFQPLTDVDHSLNYIFC